MFSQFTKLAATAAAGVLAFSALSQAATHSRPPQNQLPPEAQMPKQKDGCETIGENHDTEWRVCKDESGYGVGIKFPMKDVTWRTPLGGRGGFFQTFGHQVEGAAHGAGRHFNKAKKWVSRRLGFRG
jgi:hypothetical protein